MKKIWCLLLGGISLTLSAQEPIEQEIKSQVSEVTVYLENALETRKATIELVPGKTMLKFSGLSPFIDAKSIQAKIDGEVTLMSVNHQQNFLNKPEESQESKDLQGRIKELDQKIAIENVYLDVIQDDLGFLLKNQSLGGNQSVAVASIKEGADFFNTRNTALKLKKNEREKTIYALSKQRDDLWQQLNGKVEEKTFATGEILVLVEAKKAVTIKADLSYIVSNASWYPSYDIRANSITEPLEIVYKANIRQDTKGDWKNVKLKLSSYNPTVSGVAPDLLTYFLGYNSRPPVYQQELSSVSGRVTDTNEEPLAGVSIKVKGSNVTTVTNLRGYYTLTLPANLRILEFSLIGYDKQIQSVSSGTLNVAMTENQQALNEVVISTYDVKGVDIADLEDHKVTVEERLQGRMAGVSIRGASSIPEQERVEKAISVDFDIKTPYSVLSDNKVVTVDMDRLNLPVNYQYFAVPKLSKDVFLNAQIQDWEKYSFLEGEANVFFEDTYVGKTILDISTASDTLSISLGRDKKISVQREKVKDFVTKQFLGSKKVETRDWKTTVRNNRPEPINLVILDQVPVSTDGEIEVTYEANPTAKYTSETGEIRWDGVIVPGLNKIFDLKYTVKYPKNRRLIIE
jgi:hypothetical protein